MSIALKTNPRYEHSRTADELARLNQELKKFRLAIENTSDHIIITDPEGIVIYANKAVERITGYKSSEVMNKKAGVLWGGHMSAEFYRGLWKTIREEKKDFVGEIINKRKNGEMYHAHMTISPVLDENRNILFFVGTELDITEHIESERKLKEYAERTEEAWARDEALLLSIADGIVVSDTSGRITYANKALERISGLNAKDIVHQDMDEALPLYDEAGIRVPKEKRALYISLDPAKGKNMPVSSTAAFYLINKKSGRRVPIATSAAPLIVGKKALGAVVVWRDITREKEIDKAKSEFISFASHQLRTPLTTISLSLDMLLNNTSETLTEEQRKTLKVAWSGVRDMTEIIETLLDISRIQMGTLVVETEPTDMAKFLDKLLRNVSVAVKKRSITVKKRYDKKVPAIRIDQRLMKIVLENLISNAMKYSPAKSSILAEVKKQGKDALLAISDTGIGIPEDQQTRIFEKLFRVQSDSKVKGTGLGLYMVKAAVDQYGGRVWCESPSPRAFGGQKRSGKQKGSTFYVTVPLSGMDAK